ncbi:MAG: GGDEF domain-containing protein [Sphaerospermopsis sp. SIO1G2]|nr:GGDEF domain-containing protein [Sphaerospermopsis sp. SIO1G2]
MNKRLTEKMQADIPQDIWAHSRHIVEELRRHDIPPTAENYALWFRHLAGMDDALSEHISQQEKRREPFSPFFLEYLYTQYASVTQHRQQQDQKIQSAQDIMHDALEVIGSIIEETDSHHSHMQKTLNKMIEDNNHDINSFLSTLIVAVTEIKQNNHYVRSALQESRKEVESLKQDLSNISDEMQRDFLTGVYNRKTLDQKINFFIKEAKQSGAPLSVLMIDIDYFKVFNDTYGHLIGDEVLKMVAAILTRSVKGKDLVARFGGEEFTILLPETTLKNAMIVAENIRKVISANELQNRKSLTTYGNVSVSIGVATYQRKKDTAISWIERADDALYRAKHNGRNQVVQEQTN